MNIAPIYQIRVRGHLDDHWSAWFDGMTIVNQPDGVALLTGQLADQTALHGLLNKIRDLGLPLIAVAQQPSPDPSAAPPAAPADC